MKALVMVPLAVAALGFGASTAWGQVAVGGNAAVNGQRPGGISFVTRRVPMAVPNQLAAGYFAASGVPVGGFLAPGAGANPANQIFQGPRIVQNSPDSQAVPAEAGESETIPLTPAARQALQRLARGGNADARAALAQFSVPPAVVNPVEAPVE